MLIHVFSMKNIHNKDNEHLCDLFFMLPVNVSNKNTSVLPCKQFWNVNIVNYSKNEVCLNDTLHNKLCHALAHVPTK